MHALISQAFGVGKASQDEVSNFDKAFNLFTIVIYV